MSYVMVDVESDGEIPGDFSMIEIGAVIVRPGLKDTFHGWLCPITNRWNDEALKVSNHTREETTGFEDPTRVLLKFETWLHQHNVGKKIMFISDNNGFDFMFVSWYFWHFLNRNPFGHSSTNLGSLYKGLIKDTFHNFKHLRKTKHTHNPVDDAMGNAEALLHMKDKMGLNISLE
jgi:DNA polymerase III alpha subunit (gram-positive type)